MILPVLIRSRTSTRKLVSSIAEDDTYFQQFAEKIEKKQTEVIHNIPDLDNADPEWRVTDVRAQAAVATTTHCNSTLGVAVGPRQHVADQLLANANVTRAMQLCQAPQTEFAFIGESLGVRRVTRIFSVHGHTILDEETSAQTRDEVGLGSLEMPFQDGQRTVRDKPRSGLVGIGCRRSVAVARPAHLGAVVPARLDKRRMRDVLRDASNAGLVDASPLLARLWHPGRQCCSSLLVDGIARATEKPLPTKKQPEQSTKCGNNLCGGTTVRQSYVQRSQTWSVLTQEDERVKKSLMPRTKRTSDRTPVASTVVPVD